MVVSMNLSTVAEWIAWAGIVIPLAALAWSAVFYTVARRREVQYLEYQRFFQIMDHLGQHGGSVASKMAAAFELRKYPEYASVIINVCQKVDVEGSSAAMLREELNATKEFMEAPR
jgi:hypothetical protein